MKKAHENNKTSKVKGYINKLQYKHLLLYFFQKVKNTIFFQKMN